MTGAGEMLSRLRTFCEIRPLQTGAGGGVNPPATVASARAKEIVVRSSR
jgi:hypothetical protein